MKWIQVIGFLSWWLATDAIAQTHYSGILTSDTTFTGECIIDSDLTVPAGIVLTIEAGSNLQIANGVSILVSGTLLADGTEAQPILFTRYPANTSGNKWKQIKFIQPSDSRLRWCTFQYADSEGEHQDYYVPQPPARNYHEAIILLAGHLDFDHCIFQKLPSSSSSAEGDAIAIFSDDLDFPGPASANIRNCRFIGIGQAIHTRFSYVLVEDCYFQDKRGDNDDIDLWGESTPPPMIRRNLFDTPVHEDRINPTRCSAIIMDNIIRDSTDQGIVLRDKGSPILINNIIANCSNAGIAVENSCTATLINNTIVNTKIGIRCFDLGRWDPPYSLNPGGGSFTCINGILWNCSTRAISLENSSNTTIPDRGSHAIVAYSDIQNGQSGVSIGATYSTLTWQDGNINLDPLFTDPQNASKSLRDFHLKSQAGRWNPTMKTWVKDTVTSPCIDAGDPVSDWKGELWPNGARINMGAYGNTPQASMSLDSATGKLADIDQNGSVNLIDLARLAEVWMLDDCLIAPNLDRLGTVDLVDLALFTSEWLK